MTKRVIPDGQTAHFRMKNNVWDPDFDYERKTKFPVGTLVRCKATMLTLWSDSNAMVGNLFRGDIAIVIDDNDKAGHEAKLVSHIGTGWFDWDALEAVT